MNKIFTTVLCVAMAFTSAFAVSVSDVAGMFKGDLNIGGTMYSNKQVYILPGVTEGTITFVLPEFTYNSAPLGDIVLVNIPMSSSGRLTLENANLYIKAISERAVVSVLNGIQDGGVTYNSDVTASAVQVLLSIAAPSLPEPIIVLFAGNKVTSENYSVTNGGFEGNWSNGEPSGWHSFNTATGSYVSFVQNTEQFTQSSDTRPGSAGTHSAMIKTKVVLGNNANGNCTNGQINAGSTTATDAAGNYNFSDPSNNGYNTPFVGNPDSLVFWAKYIPADKNPSNSVNKARAHAVVTTAARYQDPESTSYASVKIADAAINYSATSSLGWQRISVPFTYSSVNPASAAYVLITFSTNYEPGGGSSYSSGSLFNKTYYLDNVYLDDVEMIYNYQLSSLKMNGQNIAFSAGRAVSTNEYSDSDYDFTAAVNGKGAVSFIGYDEMHSQVHVYVVADNYSQAKAYSLYTLQMAEPQKDTQFEYSATTCSNEPYSDNLFRGLTASGTYVDTIANSRGGDSIVTLTLTVLPAYNMPATVASICENDTYEWCGKTFENMSPGVYADTMVYHTVAGCDSVHTLTLTVLPSWVEEEKMFVNEANLVWRGKTISELPTSSEPYFFYDSLTAVNGCDSVYVLRLYVSDIPVTYGAYDAVICDGEEVEFENVIYTQAFEGDVHTAQPNIYGGDSVVHLTVTVLPSYNIDLYDTITVGDARSWEGWELSSISVGKSMLYASYYTEDDCDSTLVLHLTVLPVNISTDLNVEIGEPNVVSTAVKVMRDGHLYIVRREDEVLYDVLGRKVKN